MRINFGNKYRDKDTSEVPSGFLLWIIEEMENPEWLLVKACKAELSARLKLDWSPRSDREHELSERNKFLEKENARLLNGKIFFEKICWLFGVEEIDYFKYAFDYFKSSQTVKWLDDVIEECNKEGRRYVPYRWMQHPTYKKLRDKERRRDMKLIEKSAQELNIKAA